MTLATMIILYLFRRDGRMTRTQMCLNYEGLVFPVCPGLFFFRTTIVVGFFMFVRNDCFFYFRLFGKPFFGSLGSTTLKNWGRVSQG